MQFMKMIKLNRIRTTVINILERHLYIPNSLTIKYESDNCEEKLLEKNETCNYEFRRPKTGLLMLSDGEPELSEDISEYVYNLTKDNFSVLTPDRKIAGPRVQELKKKYEAIGGFSPLLKWTHAQGRGIVKRLNMDSPGSAPHKYYIGFRFAKPFIHTALEEIEKDDIKHLVVMSLYPQFNCVSAATAFDAVAKFYEKRQPPKMKWTLLNSWPLPSLFCNAIVQRIQVELDHIPKDRKDKVVLLFVAHNIPQQGVFNGDTYPYEVGATVNIIMELMRFGYPYTLTWLTEYSGNWIEPSTEDVIRTHFQKGKRAFVLVPVTYISEHVKTLYDLDHVYVKKFEDEWGCEVSVRRAGTVNDHRQYMDAMATLLVHGIHSKQRVSPKFLSLCPNCPNKECKVYKQFYTKVTQT